MKVSVFRKRNGPPTPDDSGEPIWVGGYSGDPESGYDQLPGSIVEQLTRRGIEVGKRYLLADFKKGFIDAETRDEQWTTVNVPVLGGVDEQGEAIEVGQYAAAIMLVTAILKFLDTVPEKGDIWIHVE